MNILVTGGTGLVGSRLLRYMVEAGVECRALVRPGKHVVDRVSCIAGDLFDADALKEAVQGVAAVIHLAAVFRTPDEDEVWRVNLQGTEALIRAVQEHAPNARFLMASTCLVYGEEATYPGLEDDELNPTQAYPASKVAAEHLLRASGLTWSILRLPFVYGDGDEHLNSAPTVVKKMGWHPAQTFSMVHQRDVARAFELALTGKLDGRTVNVVDDAPCTLFEMAKAIGVTLSSSAAPLLKPWWGRADGSLLRSLGFQPKFASLQQAARENAL